MDGLELSDDDLGLDPAAFLSPEQSQYGSDSSESSDDSFEDPDYESDVNPDDDSSLASDSSDSESDGAPETPPPGPVQQSYWHAETDLGAAVPFSGISGLQLQPTGTGLQGKVTPYDVWKLFVTDDIIQFIVTETNRYAAQKIAINRPLQKHSRLWKWADVTAPDMEQLLGAILAMGIVHMPTIASYWSTSSLYGMKLLKDGITRDKFILWLQMLHFSNNEQDDNTRLFKINGLMEKLVQRFKQVYIPGADIVVDESLIPFRGRVIFRQYLPGKAHKYGIKEFKLCTPEGYTWNARIYGGKHDKAAGLGHAQTVALELCDGLLDEHRTYYMDNFYSSPALAESLLDRSTYSCGTLRINRQGVPNSLRAEKLGKGAVFGFENGRGIRVLKWRDRRDVSMITSRPDHSISVCDTGKKDRGGQPIRKPQCILSYNAAKKGVDISDQLSSYYTTLRKTIRWYKKLGIEGLSGTSVVNACVIYNEFFADGRKLSQLQFRELLSFRLVTGRHSPPAQRGRPCVTSPLGASSSGSPSPGVSTRHGSRGRSGHRLGEKQGAKRTVRGPCASCYRKRRASGMDAKEAKKNRYKVTTYCQDCNATPFMCIPCFNEH